MFVCICLDVREEVKAGLKGQHFPISLCQIKVPVNRDALTPPESFYQAHRASYGI